MEMVMLHLLQWSTWDFAPAQTSSKIAVASLCGCQWGSGVQVWEGFSPSPQDGLTLQAAIKIPAKSGDLEKKGALNLFSYHFLVAAPVWRWGGEPLCRGEGGEPLCGGEGGEPLCGGEGVRAPVRRWGGWAPVQRWGGWAPVQRWGPPGWLQL